MGSIHLYKPHHTMRQLIRDNNLLLMAISRFNIAFGFGESTVQEACEANGVHTDTFLAVCNLLSGNDFSRFEIHLPAMMDYLKRAHSTFLDYSLPQLRHKLIDSINYSATDEVAFQLIKFYDDYVEEVRKHMAHENDVIFEYVGRLMDGRIDEAFSISDFSVNHGHMATKLRELKDVFIYHYKQKDNTRLSSVLFDVIVCEKDFLSHFEVERSLFVPAVEALENSLRSRLSHAAAEAEPGSDECPVASGDALSPREKEIIVAVAKGWANKEIADRLCLSVNTVTTHRRNICAKLGIHSAAGLTIYAILHHLVSLEDVDPAG
ncbi:MAG: LuxR C-terminal-related transcriptional regulator [Muribaculaceae bacterium]|nr:LuxR C-terminal-related transcriptional regulator [Muribaculaceae bacterium]